MTPAEKVKGQSAVAMPRQVLVDKLPYAAAARAYFDGGWRGVLPLPPRCKAWPPSGWTGHNAGWPTAENVAAWRRAEPDGNVALRLPAHVVGLDVDAYDGKAGAATLAALEAAWGELPATYMSSARDDGASGIRFYRVPEGLKWPGEAGPGIEIIQTAHRYAVVAPSAHPSGSRYRWRSPAGDLLINEGPAPNGLPELPVAWISGLAGGQLTEGDNDRADASAAEAWLRDLDEERPCGAVADALAAARTAFDGASSRHDAARKHSAALLRLAEQGHPGVRKALSDARRVFVAAVDTSERDARSEWRRLVVGGARLVLGDPTDEVARGCRCASQSAGEAQDKVRSEIETAKRRLYVQETARREHEADKAAAHLLVLPRQTLQDALALPRNATRHRIASLHKVGYNSTLTARYKTGKTTLGANLTRSLADNEPFLDLYDIEPLAGRIGLVNYELDADEMLDWLRDVGIRKLDRIAILNLRGRAFSLTHEQNRAEFVRWLRDMEVEVLSLDPHRRAFAGFGKENDNDDVNRFTETLDEIKAEANVRDLFLYVHTGRATAEEGDEHARGATALDDWADQRLILTKDKEGRRFLYSEGRLPDVPEFQLVYDPATRRLAAEAGNRRSAARDELFQRIVMVVQGAGAGGLTTTEVKEKVTSGRDKKNGSLVAGLLDEAEGQNLIVSEALKPRGQRWYGKGAR